MVEDTKFKVKECDHVASVCVKACFVCTTCIPVDTIYVFYSVSTCFVCATRICVWIQHMCSYKINKNITLILTESALWNSTPIAILDLHQYSNQILFPGIIYHKFLPR